MRKFFLSFFIFWYAFAVPLSVIAQEIPTTPDTTTDAPAAVDPTPAPPEDITPPAEPPSSDETVDPSVITPSPEPEVPPTPDENFDPVTGGGEISPPDTTPVAPPEDVTPPAEPPTPTPEVSPVPPPETPPVVDGDVPPEEVPSEFPPLPDTEISIQNTLLTLPESLSDPLTIFYKNHVNELPLSMAVENGNVDSPLTQENSSYFYRDVFPNTDLKYNITSNGIKEFIILKAVGHPDQFEYNLNLNEFDAVQTSPSTVVLYKKGESGNDLFKLYTLSAPQMSDNTGNTSSNLTFSIQGNLLTLTPDATWLAGAQYPVTIDPTIEITVLNIHSSPVSGQNWNVDFTTVGTADLTITPADQATVDEDEFTTLTCGNEDRTANAQILAGDVIFYPNWQCDDVATVTHLTLVTGSHHLLFEFAGAGETATSEAFNGTRYWVGSAGGSTNSTANWSSTIHSACGANTGASVPSSGDLAVFESDCTNNAAIDANFNLLGLQIDSGYSGIITQSGGHTVTIRSSNFSQAGGTLNMGDGTYNVSGSWTFSGGTLNADTSTVNFSGNLTITGSQTLKNVSFDAANTTYVIAGGTTLTVSGTMSNTGTANGALQGGNISAQGDMSFTCSGQNGTNNTTTITINGTGDQTLTGASVLGNCALPNTTINKSSGTLNLVSNISVTGTTWTYTAGTINAGSSTVDFLGSGGITVSGTHTLNNIAFPMNNIADTISGTLTASGNLSITGSAGLAINGGTINIGGNFSSTGTLTPSGTTAITFNGTGSQSITDTGSGGAQFTSTWTVNKASGTLSLAASLTHGGDFTVSQGTFDTGGFTLTGASTKTFTVSNGATFIMSGSSAYPASFTTYTYGATSTVRYNQSANTTITNATYGNLELEPSSTNTLTLPATVSTIVGNLTIGDASHAGFITAATNNPTLAVTGNFSLSNAVTFTGGTSTLSITGTTTIGGGSSGTFTAGTGAMSFGSTFSVANGATFTASSGIVAITGAATVGGGTSGTFSAGSGNISLASSLSIANGATFTAGGGVLLVTGTTTIGGGSSGTFTAGSGNINFNDNVTISAGATYTKGAGTVYFYKAGTLTLTDSTAGQDLGAVQVSGFLYRGSITVDHTKVPNTDQTSFPVLVSGTYNGSGGIPDLRVSGSGGKVQNASGFDIGFYTNSNCTGKMAWETETYMASTGAVNYWVNVTTLSHTSDTVFYMCYDNSVITTDQSNRTSVWDSNYKGVWHLDDNAANTTVAEATSNANTGTAAVNTSTKTVTGQVGTGLNFNGTSDVVDITATLGGSLDLAVPVTIEAWVKPSNISISAIETIFGRGQSGNNGYGENLGVTAHYNIGAMGGGNTNTTGTYTLAWHNYTTVTNGASSKSYIDGAADGSAPSITIPASSNTKAAIGASYTTGNVLNRFLEAAVDEVRVSNVARSADWISTEYNNQSSPSSFYAIGSETAETATTLSLASSVKMTSLTINTGEVFTANGSNTLTLTGTGNALVATGTFTASTGTVQYTGTTANIAATTYNNLTLGGTGTYTMSGSNTTLRGNLGITSGATITKGAGTIIFAKGGGGTQTWTDSNGTAQDLGPVQVSANSGATTLALASNAKLTTLLVDASQTFSQGASYTLNTTGAITINGTWSNIGTGDLVLGGGVTNAGAIILNSNNGSQCVDGANDIVITSTVGGTQRAWSGAGTFTVYNVNYTDMTGAGVTAYTSTASNSTWTVGNCDTTPPVLSAFFPTSSSSINSVTTSSDISFTTDEALASGLITITRSGGTSDGSSPHSCTLTGSALNIGTHTVNLADLTNGCTSDVSNLVSGSVYTFVLSGSDAAGNAATPITHTLVTFDSTAPTITNISSTKANGTYTVGEVIDINVTFSEVVTSTGSVTVTLETGTVDETCSFTVTGASSGSCNYTVQAGDTTSDLTTNSISGTIADVAGNSMSSFTPATNLAANKDIVIDTTAPAAPGTPDMTAGTDSGSSSTDDVTSDTTPDFTISCESGATVTLKEGVTTLGTGTCSSSTVTITSSALSQTTHTIKASQTDVALNTSTDSGTLSVTIDTTAPTITNVSSTKANGTYTVGEVIDINVTFSEVVTSTGSVTVTLETGTVDETCSFTVTGASSGSCNYTVQAGDTTSDLTTNSISGTIADVAGNSMSSFTPATNLAANKDIVIDTGAPNVAITAPADLSTVSGAAVLVSADATDNNSVEGVQFKLDGIDLGAEDTSSPYEITWDTTAATNGSHALTAVARDDVANSTTSATITVTVNNTSGGGGGGGGGSHIVGHTPSTPSTPPAYVYPPPVVTNPIPSVIDKVTDIVKNIIPYIPFFPKPAPPPPVIPIEDLVAKVTPPAFQGNWPLIVLPGNAEFVLAPLPKAITSLAQKFPTLAQTFQDVGVSKITDVEKLQNVQFSLPGLTTKGGVTLPSEIVFASTGGKLVNYDFGLSISERGVPQEQISTITGKPLQLEVKPEHPVRVIKGYMVFKSKLSAAAPTTSPLSMLSNLFRAQVAFAEAPAQNPQIEDKLVLLEFEYTDPDGDGIYTANIDSPVVPGDYEIITVMDFTDPALGSQEIRLTTVVDPEGYIYEKNGDKETRIPNATVTIYWLNPENKEYEVWPAAQYSQQNSQTTDLSGTYSFLVPEGDYYIKAEAPGYLSYEGKPFEVKQGSGVHTNIELRSQYWYLHVIDWKTLLLTLIIILLLYKLYGGKIREKWRKA